MNTTNNVRKLQLEKRWQSQDVYFQLITTLLGMLVFDMCHCKRFVEIVKKKKSREEVDETEITAFVNMMCGNLKLWSYMQLCCGDETMLEQICNQVTQQLSMLPWVSQSLEYARDTRTGQARPLFYENYQLVVQVLFNASLQCQQSRQRWWPCNDLLWWALLLRKSSFCL